MITMHRELHIEFKSHHICVLFIILKQKTSPNLKHHHNQLPSWELTYPTWSSSKVPYFGGYISSLEGTVSQKKTSIITTIWFALAEPSTYCCWFRNRACTSWYGYVVNCPLFTWFFTSQVVQDFWTINSIYDQPLVDYNCRPDLRCASEDFLRSWKTPEPKKENLCSIPLLYWVLSKHLYTWMTYYPIPSAYSIFIYIWIMFMANIRKYTIHGWYGYKQRING